MATLSNAEVFRAAADLIRTGGLWKGENDGPPGMVCVWVAIHDAAFAGGRYPSPLGTQAAIRATGDDWIGELYRWNDAPERTAAEVIALLEGLAHDEELKEQVAALSTPAASSQEAILPTLKEAVPVG